MVDTQGRDPELIPAEQRKRKKYLQNPRLKQEANNPMIHDTGIGRRWVRGGERNGSLTQINLEDGEENRNKGLHQKQL